MEDATNHERRTARLALVATAAGLLIALYPFLSGLDGMDGGFALNLGGALIAFTAALFAIVYARRAAMVDSLLRGEGVLAHWRYDPEEWRRFSEAEYREEAGEKRALLLLVSAMALIAGVSCFLIDSEAGAWVLAVMVAVVAILAVVALLVPRLNYNRNRRYRGEVRISTRGAYSAGALHAWNMLGARLEAAEVEVGDPSLLAVTYSFPTRYGRDRTTVRLPVPMGEERAAEAVAAALLGGTAVPQTEP